MLPVIEIDGDGVSHIRGKHGITLPGKIAAQNHRNAGYLWTQFEMFANETTEIEVVVHGKCLGLILKTNEAMRERLQSVSGAGVRFAACENTMRRMSLKMEDLMTFATTVDSGVAEVVRKQEAGWSYIKSGA